jgi:hypothetical protein
MRPEYKSKLLGKEDALVRMDVLVHDPRVLSDVREALAAGLKPVAFSLILLPLIVREGWEAMKGKPCCDAA